MTKDVERVAIATFLYEESRIEVYRAKGYTPMWHELEGVEQSDWLRKAARLQDNLALVRRCERQRVKAAKVRA